MLIQYSPKLSARPVPILHWQKFSKIKSELVKPFPGTKGLTEHAGLSRAPEEFLKRLAETLVVTCQDEGGVGLAASQIGIFKQVILLSAFRDETHGEDVQVGDYKLYVNPSWEPVPGSSAEDRVGGWESCLSVPGKRLYIERFEPIDAAWFEFSNETKSWLFQKKRLKGLQSRVFQHEVDHLCGRSILQRWEAQKPEMRAHYDIPVEK